MTRSPSARREPAALSSGLRAVFLARHGGWPADAADEEILAVLAALAPEARAEYAAAAGQPEQCATTKDMQEHEEPAEG